jgi:carbonic anhydrase
MTNEPTRPFGLAQSPILLVTEPVEHSETPLNIKIQWSAQATGTLNPPDPARDAAGELKVSFPPRNNNIVTLNGATYELTQFHFHSPGEHVMWGGMPFAVEIISSINSSIIEMPPGGAIPAPIELHMVFMATKDPATAVVLAVMVYSGESNASRDEQASSIALAAGVGNGSPISLLPYEWLPENPQFAFRYQGSLTTPDYQEIVSWVIIGMPLVFSLDVFNRLKAQKMGNSREVQPLNGRTVTYYPWPPNAITTT